MNPLNPIEVRVLGSLMEKEITTPDYYPMTLNALVNACNQKSNRDPVVSYDDDTVLEAIESLRARKLVSEITGYGNRVPKYAHSVSEAFNLGRREFAIVCVLMLRGPQTLGELRDRTERMYSFGDLEEVESCLAGLEQRQPEPFVVRLPKQPGTKEARYAHLLSGEPDMTHPAASHVSPPAAGSAERIAALEAEIAELRAQLSELRRDFDDFRRQFT